MGALEDIRTVLQLAAEYLGFRKSELTIVTNRSGELVGPEEYRQSSVLDLHCASVTSYGFGSEGVTTKPTTGHGLGLVTAQRIVEALGGEIFIESELEAGSTFVVRLPRGRGAQCDE